MVGGLSLREMTQLCFYCNKIRKIVKKNLREELFMANDRIDTDLYKKLICDMVLDIEDSRFLRQLYSYIFRERRLCGRLQMELCEMIAGMDTADLRLLWVAAKKLLKDSGE
jgi:hypothetical protein